MYSIYYNVIDIRVYKNNPNKIIMLTFIINARAIFDVLGIVMAFLLFVIAVRITKRNRRTLRDQREKILEDLLSEYNGESSFLKSCYKSWDKEDSPKSFWNWLISHIPDELSIPTRNWYERQEIERFIKSLEYAETSFIKFFSEIYHEIYFYNGRSQLIRGVSAYLKTIGYPYPKASSLGSMLELWRSIRQHIPPCIEFNSDYYDNPSSFMGLIEKTESRSKENCHHFLDESKRDCNTCFKNPEYLLECMKNPTPNEYPYDFHP